jgi:hypothetical protein
MYHSKLISALLLGTSLALGGCAADGSSLLTTGSLASGETEVAAKSERISPECMTLMAKIQELREEGTPERVEKISTGKSPTVSVKRSALAKLAELNKANSEFQLKCSKMAPAATTAAAATQPATSTAAPAAASAPAAPAAKQTASAAQ